MTNTELIYELTRIGFVLEDNMMKYAQGSISNYVTVTVGTKITSYCSLVNDEKNVDAVYVYHESYSEPGYLECDWKHTSEGYIAVDKLIEWLESKGIMSHQRRKEKLEARRKELESKGA